MRLRIENYPGSCLAHLFAEEEDGSTLYVLEVGKISGTVCLRVSRPDPGYPQRTIFWWEPITPFCDLLPESIQEVILSLFGEKVEQ